MAKKKGGKKKEKKLSPEEQAAKEAKAKAREAEKEAGFEKQKIMARIKTLQSGDFESKSFEEQSEIFKGFLPQEQFNKQIKKMIVDKLQDPEGMTPFWANSGVKQFNTQKKRNLIDFLEIFPKLTENIYNLHSEQIDNFETDIPKPNYAGDTFSKYKKDIKRFTENMKSDLVEEYIQNNILPRANAINSGSIETSGDAIGGEEDQWYINNVRDWRDEYGGGKKLSKKERELDFFKKITVLYRNHATFNGGGIDDLSATRLNENFTSMLFESLSEENILKIFNQMPQSDLEDLYETHINKSLERKGELLKKYNYLTTINPKDNVLNEYNSSSGPFAEGNMNALGSDYVELLKTEDNLEAGEILRDTVNPKLKPLKRSDYEMEQLERQRVSLNRRLDEHRSLAGFKETDYGFTTDLIPLDKRVVNSDKLAPYMETLKVFSEADYNFSVFENFKENTRGSYNGDNEFRGSFFEAIQKILEKTISDNFGTSQIHGAIDKILNIPEFQKRFERFLTPSQKKEIEESLEGNIRFDIRKKLKETIGDLKMSKAEEKAFLDKEIENIKSTHENLMDYDRTNEISISARGRQIIEGSEARIEEEKEQEELRQAKEQLQKEQVGVKKQERKEGAVKLAAELKEEAERKAQEIADREVNIQKRMNSKAGVQFLEKFKLSMEKDSEGNELSDFAKEHKFKSALQKFNTIREARGSYARGLSNAERMSDETLRNREAKERIALQEIRERLGVPETLDLDNPKFDYYSKVPKLQPEKLQNLRREEEYNLSLSPDERLDNLIARSAERVSERREFAGKTADRIREKTQAEEIPAELSSPQERGERTFRRAETIRQISEGEETRMEGGFGGGGQQPPPVQQQVAEAQARKDVEQVVPTFKGVKEDPFTSSALSKGQKDIYGERKERYMKEWAADGTTLRDYAFGLQEGFDEVSEAQREQASEELLVEDYKAIISEEDRTYDEEQLKAIKGTEFNYKGKDEDAFLRSRKIVLTIEQFKNSFDKALSATSKEGYIGQYGNNGIPYQYPTTEDHRYTSTYITSDGKVNTGGKYRRQFQSDLAKGLKPLNFLTNSNTNKLILLPENIPIPSDTEDNGVGEVASIQRFFVGSRPAYWAHTFPTQRGKGGIRQMPNDANPINYNGGKKLNASEMSTNSQKQQANYGRPFLNILNNPYATTGDKIISFENLQQYQSLNSVRSIYDEQTATLSEFPKKKFTIEEEAAKLNEESRFYIKGKLEGETDSIAVRKATKEIPLQFDPTARRKALRKLQRNANLGIGIAGISKTRLQGVKVQGGGGAA